MNPVNFEVRVAPLHCYACGAETKMIASIDLSAGDTAVECSITDFTDYPELAAQVAQCVAGKAAIGEDKRVHMKASATHIDRAALRIRAQLITARNAMANQMRGLLKLFGLRLGTARTPGRRADRPAALYRQRPDVEPLFAPLVASMEAIEKQLHTSNQRAAADPVCTRLMSVPGVGPITSLTFTASVEDPQRFARSEDVGAYAGLAPRRSQSGERDVRGNISKAGDPMLRRALYEAANIMLCRCWQQRK